MTDAADIASPVDEESPDAELPKMSFLDHLEELRKRLIVSIIAIFVAFLVCWNYADKIFARRRSRGSSIPAIKSSRTRI
jgi:Sec-independent protein secretion pathway component TatC